MRNISTQLTQADQKDTQYHTASCQQQKDRRRNQRMVIMTVSPSNCCVCLGCFPGTSWTSAFRWELVNKFLTLLCFACRLHLLNWLYLDPPVFSPSISSLSCGTGDWMRGWTHVRNWFWFLTTQTKITIRITSYFSPSLPITMRNAGASLTPRCCSTNIATDWWW